MNVKPLWKSSFVFSVLIIYLINPLGTQADGLRLADGTIVKGAKVFQGDFPKNHLLFQGFRIGRTSIIEFKEKITGQLKVYRRNKRESSPMDGCVKAYPPSLAYALLRFDHLKDRKYQLAEVILDERESKKKKRLCKRAPRLKNFDQVFQTESGIQFETSKEDLLTALSSQTSFQSPARIALVYLTKKKLSEERRKEIKDKLQIEDPKFFTQSGVEAKLTDSKVSQLRIYRNRSF